MQQESAKRVRRECEENVGEKEERQRPYHAESTGSRPITEVKLRRAGLVLAWVTGWEYPVLLTSSFHLLSFDSANFQSPHLISSHLI